MRSPLVAASLLLLCASARADDTPAQRLVGRALGKTPLMADLSELTDGIGGRATGSPAFEKAVDWGVAKLKAAGLDVKTEEVTVNDRWLGGAATLACTAPESFAVPLAAAPFTASTAPGGIEAPVVVVGKDLGKDVKFPAAAKGAIVVVLSDEMKTLDDLFAEYLHAGPITAAADKAGAVGLLLQSTHSHGLLYRHPLTFSTSIYKIPAAIISREHADRLARLAARGPVKVKLDITNTIGGKYTTRNVVAELRGREKPDEIVVLGAHLDSWDLGTGANDNGVNAALVIDVARGMKALGVAPRRTVRFVLWAGEEQGMLGSAAYVVTHAAELDKHVATVTFDVGSGRTTGFFLNGREELRGLVDEALAPAAGLGPFTQIGDAIDGTDNFDFMISGVPNLVANQDALVYTPDYHASSDTYDKVDAREAAANAAIAAALTWALADRPGPIAKRQNRAEVDKLLKATKIDEQMKAFGQWNDWQSKKRGLAK